MARRIHPNCNFRIPGRWLAGLIVAGAALLSGCASTITSEVTAFRQPDWQNSAPKTYAFDAAAAQQNDLERRTYEDWIKLELGTHGFSQVGRSEARYLVKFDYDATPRTVRVRETVYPDPFYPGPFYRPWGPHYWGPYGFYPWGWPGYWPPEVIERNVQVTQHALRLSLSEARGGKRIYQVTALHESERGSMSAVMPYLVRSAFAEFPAQNGQPRYITLKVDKK